MLLVKAFTMHKMQPNAKSPSPNVSTESVSSISAAMNVTRMAYCAMTATKFVKAMRKGVISRKSEGQTQQKRLASKVCAEKNTKGVEA